MAMTWCEGVTVDRCGVDDIRSQVDELAAEHAKEAEPLFAPQLRIDWRYYYALEEQDLLLLLGAWDSEGELVGYASAGLIRSPHYQDLVVAQHDAIYVLPGWRRSGVGIALLRALRRLARAEGAHRLIMHAKPGSALEGVLRSLRSWGFDLEEVIYAADLPPE